MPCEDSYDEEVFDDISRKSSGNKQKHPLSAFQLFCSHFSLEVLPVFLSCFVLRWADLRENFTSGVEWPNWFIFGGFFHQRYGWSGSESLSSLFHQPLMFCEGFLLLWGGPIFATRHHEDLHLCFPSHLWADPLNGPALPPTCLFSWKLL